MKTIIAIITVILFTLTADAADKWTTADTAWQASAMALMAADWGQTRYISKHPEYYETNPILGRHPSTGRVNLYFLGVMIVHPVVSYLLPAKAQVFGFDINPRRIWQAGTIIVELGCVGNNARLGIGFSF